MNDKISITLTDTSGKSANFLVGKNGGLKNNGRDRGYGKDGATASFVLSTDKQTSFYNGDFWRFVEGTLGVENFIDTVSERGMDAIDTFFTAEFLESSNDEEANVKWEKRFGLMHLREVFVLSEPVKAENFAMQMARDTMDTFAGGKSDAAEAEGLTVALYREWLDVGSLGADEDAGEYMVNLMQATAGALREGLGEQKDVKSLLDGCWMFAAEDKKGKIKAEIENATVDGCRFGKDGKDIPSDHLANELFAVIGNLPRQLAEKVVTSFCDSIETKANELLNELEAGKLPAFMVEMQKPKQRKP